MWIPSSVKLHFVFSPGEVPAEGNFLMEAAMLAPKVIITREIPGPARCQPHQTTDSRLEKRERRKGSAGTKYFQEYLNSSKFNSSLPHPSRGSVVLGFLYCSHFLCVNGSNEGRECTALAAAVMCLFISTAFLVPHVLNQASAHRDYFGYKWDNLGFCKSSLALRVGWCWCVWQVQP